MNEPSSVTYGSIHGCGNNTYDKPPYVPGILSQAVYLFCIHAVLVADTETHLY